MSKIHARLPMFPVTYTRAQNGQPGYSDLLAVPAANTATMADHVDGLGTYGAPLNPSSEPGHDHSGGHFGKPLFATVASLSMHGPQGTTGVLYPARFRTLLIDNAAGGVTTKVYLRARHFLWVPNCDSIVGAYANLGVIARINLSATTLGASDTLTLYIEVDGDEQSFSVSNPNVAGIKILSSASLAQCVSPILGTVNRVAVRATVVRAAGGASRGCNLEIHELEFGVYQT